MKPIYFIFAVHNHQPIGNFGYVLENAYHQGYKPFIELMAQHPQIKFSLHCSGILWEWFKERYPEYLDTVRAMVNRGQVELIGGGFYEAILPVIPEYDQKGQIALMNEFIQSEFGTIPQSAWLPERIWEPNLAGVLAENGVKFTYLDDAHFFAAGKSQKELTGYFVTEDRNRRVDVFSINQQLRYLVPFSPTPDKVIDFFRQVAETNNEPVCLVLADDGEKFGIWPDTYEHVYTKGWLDTFLKLLEQNSTWLKTVSGQEYRRQFPPKGRVYFPTGSYFEMSEWSLPAETSHEFELVLNQIDNLPEGLRIRRFLKGGTWRNFLAKYPETDNMYKKMLEVSEKIRLVEDKVRVNQIQINSAERNALSRAQRFLWMGQCNCAYWHGVFGGLYLPHLRDAVYRTLLQAQKIVDPIYYQRPSWFAVDTTDFDQDNIPELVVNTELWGLYFDLNQGGSLFEWDYLPADVNLTNVLTRRYESYHHRLSTEISTTQNTEPTVQTIHHLLRSKEEGLTDYLFYDWYRRSCLIDHFFHPGSNLDNFRKMQFGEQGDFVNQPYTVKVNKSKSKVQIKLNRQGNVWVGHQHIPLVLVKEISFKSGEPKITVNYQFTLLDKGQYNLWFGSEFNLAFFSREMKDEFVLDCLSEWGWTDTVHNLSLNFKFTQPADLWSFPLETVSVSEGGFERIKQGVTFVPHWRLHINYPEPVSVSFNIEVTNL